MVDIEGLTEAELDQLRKFYMQLSGLARKEGDLTTTHSIDAAANNHHFKLGSGKNNQRK
jgi:hypothetical protein